MVTTITVGWDERFEWRIEGRGENLSRSLKEMVGSRLLSTLRLAGHQNANAFVVVAREPQHFMQCLNEDGGWVLEKREGNAGSHFRAMVERPKAPREEAPSIVAKILKPPRYPLLLLTFDQVSEAMIAYATGSCEPNWINWQKVDV